MPSMRTQQGVMCTYQDSDRGMLLDLENETMEGNRCTFHEGAGDSPGDSGEATKPAESRVDTAEPWMDRHTFLPSATRTSAISSHSSLVLTQPGSTFQDSYLAMVHDLQDPTEAGRRHSFHELADVSSAFGSELDGGDMYQASVGDIDDLIPWLGNEGCDDMEFVAHRPSEIMSRAEPQHQPGLSIE